MPSPDALPDSIRALAVSNASPCASTTISITIWSESPRSARRAHGKPQPRPGSTAPRRMVVNGSPWVESS